jgi:hypothetical protein
LAPPPGAFMNVEVRSLQVRLLMRTSAHAAETGKSAAQTTAEALRIDIIASFQLAPIV